MPTLKDQINHILIPRHKILFLYGVFSLLLLTSFVFYFSFSWFIGIDAYVISLLIALSSATFIASKLDKKHRWKTRMYFRIAIVQLILIWTVSGPIRAWQIESSKAKSELIINSLELYKKDFGVYPNTLEQLKSTFNQSLPKRTNLGTKYWYSLIDNQKYQLYFKSYYGYYYQYVCDTGEWIYDD